MTITPKFLPGDTAFILTREGFVARKISTIHAFVTQGDTVARCVLEIPRQVVASLSGSELMELSKEYTVDEFRCFKNKEDMLQSLSKQWDLDAQ